MKTTNRKCREYINDCLPFEGNNLSGVVISENVYIVYSYGCWPIWANIHGQWYGHKEKYSRTTSCHTIASKPDSDDIIILESVDELKAKISEAC